MFDRIGVKTGAHVVEIGCGAEGCIDLLASRVGTTGRVLGIERNAEAVKIARHTIAPRNLRNVEVLHGDGRHTPLPRGAFDAVIARLVLVNVSAPEEIVTEAVAVTRPGGVVAFHELAWPMIFDPPIAAWDRFYELLQIYAASNGMDLFIGSKLPTLLSAQGLSDVETNELTHIYRRSEGYYPSALEFVARLSGRLLAQGLLRADELADMAKGLEEDLMDAVTFTMVFVQAWGRRPPV